MSVSLPERRIPGELLADLHAHNLDPATERELWDRVRNDPEALRVLAALDDVTARLRAADDGPVAFPVPADVADRLDRAVVTETARRRHQRRFRRWAVPISAAAAVLITAGVAVGVLSDSTEASSPSVAADAPADVPSRDLMLSALGQNSVSGPLADRDALVTCVRAAGERGPLLGSLDTDYRGESAVLVLVGGIRPGSMTALIVGRSCGPDDPQVLARTELG